MRNVVRVIEAMRTYAPDSISGGHVKRLAPPKGTELVDGPRWGAWVINLMLLTLIMVPVIHSGGLEWGDFPFLVASVCMALYAAGSRWALRQDMATDCIYAFCCLCVVHVVFVITGHVSLSDYVRGLIPFVFLSYLAMFRRLIHGRAVQTCYWGITMCGVLYATQALYSVPEMLSGSISRTTAVNLNSVIPIPLIAELFAAAYLFEHRRLRVLKRLTCGGIVALCFVSSVLSGTKSLVLGCTVPLAYPLLLRPQRLISWFVKMGLALTSVCVVLTSVIPFDVLLRAARISIDESGTVSTLDEASISRRSDENKAALELFLSAPVLGNGLGFKFDTSAYYRSSPNDEERVGYVHNGPLYLLMDFGLAGLMYLVAPMSTVAYSTQYLKKHRSPPLMGVTMAIIGCLIYLNFFAMVRLIQFNVVLTFLIAMAGVLRTPLHPGARQVSQTA